MLPDVGGSRWESVGVGGRAGSGPGEFRACRACRTSRGSRKVMSVRGRKYRRRAGGAEKIKDNKRQSDKVMFGFGRFVLYGGLLSFLLLAAGCIGEETPSPEESTLVGVGEMAPDFTVEMFDGSEVRLSELRGRVVLLTFFASWCPECRDELSVVQRQVLDRFSGDDFSFLCISRGESRETIAAFRSDYGHSYPMGLDFSASIYGMYATEQVPRNYLLDRTGRIVCLTVGYEASEFEILLQRLESELRK